MPFANRCSHEFDSGVRSRGERYFRQGRVQIQAAGGDSLSARVRGSCRYAVLLDWSGARGGAVESSCTCPYFADVGPCKHIWATLLAADALALGPPAGSGRLAVAEAKSPGEPDEDDLNEDDLADFAPRVERFSAGRPSYRAGEAVGGPPWRRTRRRAPSGRITWRDRLAAVFQEGSSANLGGPALPLPGKTREVWYVLDVTSTAAAGTPVIRFYQRETKLNGEFGKRRAVGIVPGELKRFTRAEDREILRLLLASDEPREGDSPSFVGRKSGQSPSYFSRDPYRNGYGYYGYVPRIPGVSLAAGGYEYLLPKLCATGRLVWMLDSSQQDVEEDGRPLAWDDGPPWRFRLRVEADDARGRWVLAGELIRQGQEAPIPLAKPVLLLAKGLVLLEDRLARLEAGDVFEWIAALRKSTGIDVPYRDRWELLESLWQLASRPEMDLPANLRCEEVRLPPEGRLTVHSPGGSYANRLYADVEFQYGGKRVAAGERCEAVLDAEHERVLVRDRDKEREMLAFLAERGVRPSDRGGAHEHALWIPHQCLGGLVQALVQAGWIVEADGQRIRKAGQWRLVVTSGVDWFDLEGTCDFDGASARLPDVLEALRHGQEYVRLDDGSRGLLPQEWLAQFGALANLGEAEGPAVRFRPCQALLLDALLAAEKDASVDRQFAHVRRKLRSFQGVARRGEPRGFRGQLRDYQKDGLGWLDFLRDFRLGGCLADDMGLGKTVQVLALLQSRRLRPKRGGRRGPSLVVVPRSLVFNWIDEARRFTPNLRIRDYTGQLRNGALEDLDQCDLMVTTYGTLHRDIAKLKDIRFDYAILDEAQAIKNAQSQRAKACRLLQADHRLAMTGTPVENHLGELWSLFEFLNPGMLGRSSAFQQFSKSAATGGTSLTGTDGAPCAASPRWSATQGVPGMVRGPSTPFVPQGVPPNSQTCSFAGAKNAAESEGNLAVLRRALGPFILRRTKQQVLTELPQKTEQTLHCDLEGIQRKKYDELRDYYRATLSERIEQNGLANSKIHVLEALLRLRQAACHLGLLDRERRDESSAKLDVLLAQLAEVLDEGHKALVFSQFTSLLAIVRRRLDAEKIVYEYLDGRTRDRKQRVERFQNDPACPLFLISLKAGGQGLNLTAADYVFILDPWWNPAVEAQAVDRTHRIGQTRRVFAYRLIARDTVEEKIVELQRSKRHLAEAIVSAGDHLLRTLTAEDAPGGNARMFLLRKGRWVERSEPHYSSFGGARHQCFASVPSTHPS
jgi:superfamily II DNA or RNA helicase